MQSGESSGQTQVYPSGLVGLSRHSVELLQLVLLHGFSTVERKTNTLLYISFVFMKFVLLCNNRNVLCGPNLFCVCQENKKSPLNAWLIVCTGSLHLFWLLKISVFDAQLNDRYTHTHTHTHTSGSV